jgi:hypothetical protein
LFQFQPNQWVQVNRLLHFNANQWRKQNATIYTSVCDETYCKTWACLQWHNNPGSAAQEYKGGSLKSRKGQVFWTLRVGWGPGFSSLYSDFLRYTHLKICYASVDLRQLASSDSLSHNCSYKPRVFTKILAIVDAERAKIVGSLRFANRRWAQL